MRCWRAAAARAQPSTGISARCSIPARSASGYLERAVSAGRRKELRRQRRRLEEFAPVTFDSTSRPGRDRRGAAGFPGAGGERLEGRRRNRHRRRSCDQGLRADRGRGARRRRPCADRPHDARRTRGCRHRHAAKRRHRLVLEDRLQRRHGALFARRAAHLRADRTACRRPSALRGPTPAPPPAIR